MFQAVYHIHYSTDWHSGLDLGLLRRANCLFFVIKSNRGVFLAVLSF